MGRLTIVPTPIGNLQDITYRAIEVLKECDAILAEDTRTTLHLLKHFDISNQLFAFHMRNEHNVLDKFVNMLKSGKSLALVSDAGTPGISDPGYLLIREAINQDIPVECLPGASAIIPAVVASGLPCDKFYFEGFLPHKKGRMKRIEEFKGYHQTIVLYESPHRIVKLLTQLVSADMGSRKIVVCRELSKLHEEYIRGTVTSVLEELESRPSIKGELVVVLDPNQKDA